MAATVNRPMSPAEWGMLLTLSVLWGGSFFFTGVALRALPPFTLVALRLALAAVMLLTILRLSGQPLPRGRQVWRAFLTMGLINNLIPFCLIVWGQTQLPSGLASILNATTPLATVVVAHVLTKDEKMTGNRLAGVLLGLAGVAVMMGSALSKGFGGDVLAQVAILLAAVSYAFAGVYGRRFRAMGISPLATATGQVTASALLLMPLALAVDRPWLLPLPGGEVWAAVLGIAGLSTALAYVLYFRILATAGATNLLLVTFLIPVSAILLGALALGERLEAHAFAGMALIGAGLAAIDGRLVPGRRNSA